MSENSKLHKNPKTILGFVAIFSGFGLICALYLTYHFYEIRFGLGESGTICDWGRTISCSAVAVSKTAEAFWGIPLSSVAATWFLTMVILSFLSQQERLRRGLVPIMVLGSGFALVTSLVCLYIMATAIRTYCPFCLGIDLANVVIFSLLLLLKPRFRNAAISRWSLSIGTFLAAGLVIFISGKVLLARVTPSKEKVEELADQVLASPVLALSKPNDVPTRGATNAPIEIVEFMDFQCPHCRLGSMTIDALLARYPGKIKIEVRNLPWDIACNPMMEGYETHHHVACKAAQAGICAAKQGKFERFHHSILEAQVLLTDEKIARVAKESGLDISSFDDCMHSPATKNAVRADVEEAMKLELQGTPTFFVNGRKIGDPFPISAWEALIDRMVAPRK